MIDLRTEDAITLTAAARHRLISPDGRPRHIARMYDYILHGLLGLSGERVRLEFVKIGGKRYTTVQAMERFTERLNMADSAKSIPTTSQRRQQIAAAEKNLQAAGI